MSASSSIVGLPDPPYFAVIAPAALADDVTGYPTMAERAVASAATRIAQVIDHY